MQVQHKEMLIQDQDQIPHARRSWGERNLAAAATTGFCVGDGDGRSRAVSASVIGVLWKSGGIARA